MTENIIKSPPSYSSPMFQSQTIDQKDNSNEELPSTV